MWSKIAACLLLLVPLASSRADDSPLVKTSSDQRIRITLLYVGPVHDTQWPQPFVICYLIEDNRSDEELQRHPFKDAAGNVDGQYYLAPSTPQLKDTHHQVLDRDGPERARGYNLALEADFKATYPGVKLPNVDHPERAGIYEYFYKTLPTGPFDIEMYDRIPAYENSNLFHFRDIESGTNFTP